MDQRERDMLLSHEARLSKLETYLNIAKFVIGGLYVPLLYLVFKEVLRP